MGLVEAVTGIRGKLNTDVYFNSQDQGTIVLETHQNKELVDSETLKIADKPANVLESRVYHYLMPVIPFFLASASTFSYALSKSDELKNHEELFIYAMAAGLLRTGMEFAYKTLLNNSKLNAVRNLGWTD